MKNQKTEYKIMTNKKEITKKDELLSKFRIMSDSNKLVIALTALSYMQQYNGRLQTDCIALATRDFLQLEFKITDDEIINGA